MNVSNEIRLRPRFLQAFPPNRVRTRFLHSDTHGRRRKRLLAPLRRRMPMEMIASYRGATTTDLAGLVPHAARGRRAKKTAGETGQLVVCSEGEIMTKRVLRFTAYGVIVILLFVLVGLEGYYRILLPNQLPTVSAEPIPSQVRDALWLGCGANRKHDLHPLFPFIISLFFPQNRPDELLLSQIARIHIGRLQQEGRLPHEKNLKFQLREAAVSTWISRHWTADQAVDTYGSLVWMGSGCTELIRRKAGQSVTLTGCAPHGNDTITQEL